MTITCTLLVLLGAVKDQLASQTGEVSERSEGGCVGGTWGMIRRLFAAACAEDLWEMCYGVLEIRRPSSDLGEKI